MRRLSMAAIGFAALSVTAPAMAADMAVKAAPPPSTGGGDLQLSGFSHWRQWRLGAEPWLRRFPDARRDCRRRLRRSLRRPRWRTDRVPLANQPVCARIGSPGRLGRNQEHPRKPDRSIDLHHRQDRWHRTVHGPTRLGMERVAVLPEGWRCGNAQSLDVFNNVDRSRTCARQVTRAGAVPSASVGNMASARTGRSVSSTTISGWDVTATPTQEWSRPGGLTLSRQRGQPRCGHGHTSVELSLRRLWCAGHRSLLTGSIRS